MQDTNWDQFSMWGAPQQPQQPQQPQYFVSGGMYTPTSSGWGAPEAPAWGNEEQEESDEEEEVEENEDVKCGFCQGFLAEPRVLGCMHNFCTTCLQQQASMSRLTINCPICGHAERLDPKNGALGLQRNYELDEIVEERKQQMMHEQMNGQAFQPPAAPIASIFPKATEEAEVIFINNNISSYPSDHVFVAEAEKVHSPIPDVIPYEDEKETEKEDESPRIVEKEPDDFTKFLLSEASNRNGPATFSHPIAPPPTYGAPTSPSRPSAPLYPSLQPMTEVPYQPNPYLPSTSSPPSSTSSFPQFQPEPYTPTIATVPVYATYASAPSIPPTTTATPPAIPQRPTSYVPSTQLQQQQMQQPPQQPSVLMGIPQQSTTEQEDLCHPSLLNHKRINFAPYSRKPEALDASIAHWIKSLWFPPAGFFEEMKKESIKMVYTPFWYFNVDVTTQYQGQVCKLIDDKGRKVETWHVASGNRKGNYHGRLMYAGPDNTLKELLASCKKHWNLKLIKFAPPSEEERKQKEEEDYKNSTWAGKLFKAIASVASSAPPSHNPPDVELLMPFVKWEVIWRQFERELIKNEEAEAAGKLSRELLATKVKDVKINMTVQVNKWLVYMPTGLVTYSYGNAIYKVVANGQTGEIVGERPAYGTGKLGEMGKAGLDMLGSLLWKKQ